MQNKTKQQKKRVTLIASQKMNCIGNCFPKLGMYIHSPLDKSKSTLDGDPFYIYESLGNGNEISST